jgi:hypothetical protein
MALILPKRLKNDFLNVCDEVYFHILAEEGFGVSHWDGSLSGFMLYETGMELPGNRWELDWPGDFREHSDYLAGRGPWILQFYTLNNDARPLVIGIFPASGSRVQELIRESLRSATFDGKDIVSFAGDKKSQQFIDAYNYIVTLPESRKGAKFGKAVNVAAIERLLGGRRPKALAEACGISIGTAKNIFKHSRCRQSEDGSARDGNTIEALVAGLAKLTGHTPDEIRAQILS